MERTDHCEKGLKDNLDRYFCEKWKKELETGMTTTGGHHSPDLVGYVVRSAVGFLVGWAAVFAFYGLVRLSKAYWRWLQA